MIKKILIAILLFSTLIVHAKKVKITVSPEDAKIFVDGNYVADGITTINIKRNDGFIVLKFEKEGYVTTNTKIYFKDKRKAISYTLRADKFILGSVISGNANRFFSQEISEGYIKHAGNEEDASVLVWKMLHQILLNYFEEIESSDKLSGFIQTPWEYKSFSNAGIKIRTRITVKESNIGGKLTYKMKISSEMAPGLSNKEESFKKTDRILKKYENIISEFQSRLGKI